MLTACQKMLDKIAKMPRVGVKRLEEVEDFEEEAVSWAVAEGAEEV